MKYSKHPVTGCRPAQLVGLWSIEPQAFERLQEQALAALAGGQLEIISKQSKELVDEERAEPYQLGNDGVAHFSINGPITRYPTSMQALTGGTSSLLVEQALRKAASDSDVKGAMFHIDSPGGHSCCAADLAAAIRSFGKPTASHIAGSGTSLAYRIAIETDHISMDPAAITGSVGTMMRLADTSEVFKRAGVKPHYITTGDRKAVGAPGTVLNDDHIAEMQQLTIDVGKSFGDAVRERRPKISPEHFNDVMRAGLYAANKAKDIGLVDSVSDTTSAIDSFKTSLSTGSRSPVALPTPAAATQQRSAVMALTPEQLEQAKKLPGCQDISAENADGKLLARNRTRHGQREDPSADPARRPQGDGDRRAHPHDGGRHRAGDHPRRRGTACQCLHRHRRRPQRDRADPGCDRRVRRDQGVRRVGEQRPGADRRQGRGQPAGTEGHRRRTGRPEADDPGAAQATPGDERLVG
jgi:ClpP class serine protease